jgi:epoxyqueuosine reductase
VRFSGTPIKRTGRDRVVRNALIATGNSADSSLLRHVVPLLEDASPLVRAMAIWAARRLADAEEFHALRRRFEDREPDREVAAEWIMPMEEKAA